ncbi:hypothetical protein ASPNIDRAFT_45518 [Aspergillus niger ATCC 1015]|uniref:Uncharacterized protein n=1 Tax=Aspergillus niger (strain ATCC 1015 / CBS 113.46 / FGSC A1144 / LSHB Ac4 / NCTC 3858a / NRRL 328 / USDA 3528.7) TaxID=380704 RepID=G3Y6S8_ASPNA|nr:hypothetical protein ASPNIDRAFT_45518 [Aspergillus niger ATCC 1015]
MTECVCVTSSLYTPTYGAGGREHNAKLASSDYNDHFGSSCDAISDGAYNIKVTIYGFDAFVSPIYARTFPKLSKISYRVRNLEPTSIERPSYDSCVAESSKHGIFQAWYLPSMACIWKRGSVSLATFSGRFHSSPGACHNSS